MADVYAYIVFNDLEYVSDELDSSVPSRIRSKICAVSGFGISFPGSKSGTMEKKSGTMGNLKDLPETKKEKKKRGKEEKIAYGGWRGGSDEKDIRRQLEEMEEDIEDVRCQLEEVMKNVESKKREEEEKIACGSWLGDSDEKDIDRQLEEVMKNAESEKRKKEKAKYAHFTITKEVDSASTQLHKKCIEQNMESGKHGPMSEIGLYVFNSAHGAKSIHKDGGGKNTHTSALCVAYIFKGCSIDSLSVNSGSGDDNPDEELNIRFKGYYSYIKIRKAEDDGSAEKFDWDEFHWDFEEEKPGAETTSESKESLQNDIKKSL
jgi:hypothetical protein